MSSGGSGVPGNASYARRMTRKNSVRYMGCVFGVLAGAGETGGRFGLMEMAACRGMEPSRHVHYKDDEAFYVLEGGITFYVGDAIHEASPGTFVYLPHGIPHSYVFETETVRALALVAPGGIENHFRDPRFSEPAGTLAPSVPGSPPDPDFLKELTKDLESYGTGTVGPPGPP